MNHIKMRFKIRLVLIWLLLLSTSCTCSHDLYMMKSRSENEISLFVAEGNYKSGLVVSRPLVIFDLETTGLSKDKDRIVEIGAIKILPEKGSKVFYTKVNPGKNIPDKVSQIHGITNEIVDNAPKFDVVGKEFIEFINGSDLSGYNITNFDIPFLKESFNRSGIEWNENDHRVVDVMTIFRAKLAFEGNTFKKTSLDDAHIYYCGQVMKNAHQAMGDVVATMKVLQMQCKAFNNKVECLNEVLDKWFLEKSGKVVYSKSGEEVLTFGRYRGVPIRDWSSHDKKYLSSYIMTGRSKMSDEAKKIVKEIAEGSMEYKSEDSQKEELDKMSRVEFLSKLSTKLSGDKSKIDIENSKLKSDNHETGYSIAEEKEVLKTIESSSVTEGNGRFKIMGLNSVDGRIDSKGKFVFMHGSLEPSFNFGKHRGKSFVYVLSNHPDYIDWMLTAGFDQETKSLVRNMTFSYQMGKSGDANDKDIVYSSNFSNLK